MRFVFRASLRLVGTMGTEVGVCQGMLERWLHFAQMAGRTYGGVGCSMRVC